MSDKAQKVDAEGVGDEVKLTGLAALRVPFPDSAIGKLPKPTKRQTSEVRDDYKKGIRCDLCGQWHHKDVVHLDYVGHAALTDRLLDVDLDWDWDPVSYTEKGLPQFDPNGGLWIKLTVCGKTRLGYGDADGKTGGNAVKEIIGDALRNAGMRFGMALDLWHKGDLHGADNDAGQSNGGNGSSNQQQDDAEYITQNQCDELVDMAESLGVQTRAICKTGNIESLSKIRAEDFDRVMGWVKSQRKAMN